MSQPPDRDVWRVCEEALARDEAERGAFLDVACTGDEALRREVESLIAGQAEASGFLETPAFVPAAPLAPGSSLGAYEIVSRLGAGGMGEVYKARDRRLERLVAIKVLPPAFATDPARRARFEREAKTIAGLSHPNICTLYDTGREVPGRQAGDEGRTAGRTERAEPIDFLVMECLEGQTLAARLEKGKLRLDEAVATGAQIADALAAAHGQGVIHRDLKPTNVMLVKPSSGSTSAAHVKLLDFGLAKLRGDGEQPAAARFASTRQASLTAEGTIVGTLHYMAPEQLEGKVADARTDLWALGAILYELVTGQRAFEGTSAVSLMSAIMGVEPPPLVALQPVTPPALDRLVRKCLAKAPDSRWQTAADVADELRWLASQPVGPSSTAVAPGRRRGWRIAAAVSSAVLLPLAAFVLGAWLFRLPAPPSASTQRLMFASSEMDGGEDVAVSPDGRMVAFTASERNGASRLYVRRLDESHPRVVTSMPGRLPCFSPDGQWLGFLGYEERRAVIWKVPVTGGAPWRVHALGGEKRQVKWLADGRILVSRDAEGIGILNTQTGANELLVGPKDTGRGGRYLWPEMLPGNGAVLFSIWLHGRASLFAFSLRDRRLVPLVDPAVRARYVATAGHLVYQSGRQLFAVPFDPDALKITGERRLLADEAGDGDTFSQEYDVSPAGVLVYLPPHDSQLAWKDRAGKISSLPFKPRRYRSISLSRDGRQAVLHVAEGTANRLYKAELDRGEPLTRLTAGDDDGVGLFSPDGSRVVFTSGQGGHYNLASVSRDGRIDQLTTSPHWQKATSFWPLGPILLINDIPPQTRADVFELRLDGSGAAPRPLVVTDGGDVGAVFSPDGRFIAYEQTTDGRQEVYIRGYPSGPTTRVSVDGGWTPVWNPKGGELFFSSANRVMAVRVENGVRLATPVPLFEQLPYLGGQTWDVSPDGSRFLVAEAPRGLQVNVVTNWLEELKAKALPAR